MNLDFFQNIAWFRLSLYLILSTFFLGNLATFLKKNLFSESGYSRKINHFGHMVISTPLLAFLPANILIPTVLVGSVLVILIYGLSSYSQKEYIYGIVNGSLRETDGIKKRFFFFFPLITGNLALVISVLIYPLDFVRVAFFTVAFADGFAEPAGLRFGKNNNYSVRDYIWGGYNKKSIAGSTTVFLFSFVICFIFHIILNKDVYSTFKISLIYGLLISIIEAVSPRGTDNMNILLVAPLIVLFLQFFFK
ncbi:hypothetical protein [Acinetobacter pollinis]|uniref:Phosphatidate cytidylyltransferase n=1 Tax=Acinetobacter pollinis TaxID=2605270 RepID=A0ABU6DVG6_9GAMM|nr:hypothetical protein [Acinetobacter pollinis]MEB5477841.1 hypothetical protein [Acinetobacter pollinis]